MYISKKVFEIMRDTRGFVGQDDRSVYCLIKQEIKNNPTYKNVRFMSEKKFYQCLEIGKYLDENELYNSQLNNVLELYLKVGSLKRRFKFECYQKWYTTVLEDTSMSRNKFSYVFKLLVRHQKREKENE